MNTIIANFTVIPTLRDTCVDSVLNCAATVLLITDDSVDSKYFFQTVPATFDSLV